MATRGTSSKAAQLQAASQKAAPGRAALSNQQSSTAASPSSCGAGPHGPAASAASGLPKLTLERRSLSSGAGWPRPLSRAPARRRSLQSTRLWLLRQPQRLRWPVSTAASGCLWSGDVQRPLRPCRICLAVEQSAAAETVPASSPPLQGGAARLLRAATGLRVCCRGPLHDVAAAPHCSRLCHSCVRRLRSSLQHRLRAVRHGRSLYWHWQPRSARLLACMPDSTAQESRLSQV